MVLPVFFSMTIGTMLSMLCTSLSCIPSAGINSSPSKQLWIILYPRIYFIFLCRQKLFISSSNFRPLCKTFSYSNSSICGPILGVLFSHPVRLIVYSQDIIMCTDVTLGFGILLVSPSERFSFGSCSKTGLIPGRCFIEEPCTWMITIVFSVSRLWRRICFIFCCTALLLVLAGSVYSFRWLILLRSRSSLKPSRFSSVSPSLWRL